MLELRAVHTIAPEQVESIRVETYQTALDVTGNFAPRTAFEAKFSLPYVAAHALRFGTVRLEAFGEQQLADEGTRALLKKVQLVADPQLSAGFPNVRAARVIVTLRDGRVLEHFAPCRKGDPEAPLSDAELDEKFIELAGPVIGAARAASLLDQLWHVDRLQVSDLRLQEL
jgi:2-methylcitrate dehydratase PrpD